jgi:hypothetical protein
MWRRLRADLRGRRVVRAGGPQCLFAGQILMVDPGVTAFTAPWMLVKCTTFATQGLQLLRMPTIAAH